MNKFNRVLIYCLTEMDKGFTYLLDVFGVHTSSRIPYDRPSGQYGPVNPGRKNLLEAIRQILSKIKVTGIIDCGANVGHLARTYAQIFPGASIYAFEPVPEPFIELQKKSQPFPMIKPINKAVGSYSRKAMLFETENSSCSSLSSPTLEGLKYYPDDYCVKKKYEVEVTSLDDWWLNEGKPAIQFIKMDVQGGELEVLKGATSLLKESDVFLILSEVVFYRQYSNGCLFSELEIFLRNLGYSFYQFYELWTHRDGRLPGCDALFLRNI